MSATDGSSPLLEVDADALRAAFFAVPPRRMAVEISLPPSNPDGQPRILTLDVLEPSLDQRDEFGKLLDVEMAPGKTGDDDPEVKSVRGSMSKAQAWMLVRTVFLHKTEKRFFRDQDAAGLVTLPAGAGSPMRLLIEAMQSYNKKAQEAAKN